MNARHFIIALMLVGSSNRASELHWQNGEWVGGHFVGIEDGHVIWRTPMFSEDFKVSVDVLKRVNRFKTDAKTEEAFSIRLADGSRLYGTVTGMDATRLTMQLRSPAGDRGRAHGLRQAHRRRRHARVSRTTP